MNVRWSARTDVGRTRDHNEDSYGAGEGPDVERLGQLFVVCDGMGGHAAGEVASRIGVDTIVEHYYTDERDDRAAALDAAFTHANVAIHRQGRGKMGTTGVAALLHHDALVVANVGDSRAYLVREASIRQISRDHSFVSDQVAAGLITAEEARHSPVRNVITRALGHQPDVTVDLFRFPLQVGDLVLLSSDGLHGSVTDDELAQIASGADPDAAVDQLIDLANARGGPDNITALLVRVDRLDWDAALIDDDTTTPTDESWQSESRDDRANRSLVALEVPPQPTTSVGSPTHPAERRLTVLGGLLATVVLAALVFVILVTLDQPFDPALRVVPAPTRAAATATP